MQPVNLRQRVNNFLAYAVTEIFLIFSWLTSRNGRTAILFSGGLNWDLWKSSPRNNQITAAPKTRPATPVATNFGLRRTHLVPRAKMPVRAPESVHALASVPNPRPARERKSNDALDLSLDT